MIHTATFIDVHQPGQSTLLVAFGPGRAGVNETPTETKPGPVVRVLFRWTASARVQAPQHCAAAASFRLRAGADVRPPGVRAPSAPAP